MSRSTRAALLVSLALLLALAFGLRGRPAAAQTTTVSATLIWTAPGDDGLLGRASRYDLRYSTSAISGADTLSWWNAASVVNMTGRVPSASGAADSVAVSGLAAATRYYFILRAGDEVPNWSGYSNLAVLDTRDVIAPIRISDLRAR